MNDIPGSELTTEDLDAIDMLEDRNHGGKDLIVELIKFYDTKDEMNAYIETLYRTQGFYGVKTQLLGVYSTIGF